MFNTTLPIEHAIVKADAVVEKRKELSFFGAVKTGNVITAELFLRKGVNIDCTDSHGLTALHWAVQNTNKLMVSFLIKRGADPNAVCSENLQTPVVLAARSNSVPILHYLIQHGGNENYCDCRGVDILCYAVSNSAALTTEYLVSLLLHWII